MSEEEDLAERIKTQAKLTHNRLCSEVSWRRFFDCQDFLSGKNNDAVFFKLGPYCKIMPFQVANNFFSKIIEKK